eukprot:Skav221929  [mRNA]  locus=scaffold195:275249:280413:+ [translate_table: standard]
MKGADSYCLLCSLVRRFRCDTMLWDFARQLNQPEERDVDAWALVEVAAAKAPAAQAPENLAKRLKLQTDAEIVRVAASEAADYSASCHEEAQSRLWKECMEMHGVHQEDLEVSFNAKSELLRALTAEQLMATAEGTEDLAKARRRLRAMQRNRGAISPRRKVQHSADEHELQQCLSSNSMDHATQPDPPRLRRIFDQQMADSLGIKGPSTSYAFLTEPLDETEEVEVENDEVGTASGGPVSRGTDQGAFARGYELEHDIREEPTTEPTVLKVCSPGIPVDVTGRMSQAAVNCCELTKALRNVLSEPLTRESAEQSSLLSEVKQLCLSARRPPVQPQVAAQRREHPSRLKARQQKTKTLAGELQEYLNFL